MLGEWTEWNVSVIEQDGNRFRRREAGKLVKLGWILL